MRIHRPSFRDTLRYGRQAFRDQRGGFPTFPFTVFAGFDPSGMHNNLKAYWKLEEASGQRNDSHSTNHLTDNNTVTQAAGKQGNAAQFTKANSEYLSIVDNAALSMGDIDFTVSCWFYADSYDIVPGNPTLMGKGSGGATTSEWGLWIGASNYLRLWVRGPTTSGEAVASSFGVVPTLTWGFVVAWHDATANTISIQINDGPVDSASYSDGSQDSTHVFQIGNDGGPTANFYWNGRIDEVAIWKRVLTAA